MPTQPADITDYVDELIDNVYIILDNKREWIGAKKIYKNEDSMQARFPSITIELDTMSEEWIRMPRQKKLNITLSIMYYHEAFKESTLREKVRQGLSKISTVLRENWDINDYCPNHGSNIDSATPYLLTDGEDIIAGGQITLTCYKEITVVLA